MTRLNCMQKNMGIRSRLTAITKSLEQGQRLFTLAKLLLVVGFAVHVLAYHVMLLRENVFWFWALNDTAILLYTTVPYVFGRAISDKFLRVFSVAVASCAVNNLFDTITGNGAVYNIQEYVLAAITIFFAVYEYRKEGINDTTTSK